MANAIKVHEGRAQKVPKLCKSIENETFSLSLSELEFLSCFGAFSYDKLAYT